MNIRTTNDGSEPSVNTNLPGQPPRQIICLDLDENIVSVLYKSDQRSGLSNSAELCICPHTQLERKMSALHVNNPTTEQVCNDEEVVVRALNLPEWKAFFEKVIAVNKRYKELSPDDTHPLIVSFILTSASYTFSGFMPNVFKEFFGEEIATEICGSSHRFYNIHTQIMFQAHDDKGVCMNNMYNRVWTRKPDEKLPNLNFVPDVSKENVWLIDDSERHCKSACRHGFSAIHNPTSTRNRSWMTFYTAEKEKVYKKMDAIVAKAEEYCNELAANQSKDKENSSTNITL